MSTLFDNKRVFSGVPKISAGAYFRGEKLISQNLGAYFRGALIFGTAYFRDFTVLPHTVIQSGKRSTTELRLRQFSPYEVVAECYNLCLGSHSELVAKRGTYYTLTKKQNLQV